MEEPKYIHNIVKEYPKMIRIEIYHEPLKIFPHRAGNRRKKVDNELYEPDERSLRRSQQLVHDYIVCNRFEYFCTFTFNPKKFPKCFDPGATRRKITSWLSSQRLYHSPDLQYLCIPERHKSGQIHFHALISHFNGTLRDSGHKKDGKVIYNMTGFRYGFTTAIKIGETDEDYEKVGAYVSKYITKDMSKDFNNHRYLASRNLKKPIKTYNSDLFARTLPLGRKKLYDTEISSVYKIDPNFYQHYKAYADKAMRDIVRNRQKLQNALDNYSDESYTKLNAMSHNISSKTIAEKSNIFNKHKR